jgi:TolB-like protein/tetratricopeptide (TPR) repeat protein
MGITVSFVAELKQRKVVRVAMVYLVVAWVAIQAASIALPTFAAPAWALRVVILLFALGFPLALLLTWALDLTPAGVRMATGKVGNKRIFAICAGLVVLALGWYFVGQPAWRGGAGMVPERSVAVLPFVNMSGDPKNEYFSDGLAETTLDMLAQVPDLKVIARTSSFAFKGKAQDMRHIGAALGAAHLLEGSVQQAGDTVRITVQLIRAADGSHLWSQHYDRPLVDVFRIQDEIASHVVQALQVALPEPEQRRLARGPTRNVAAYREYLKGIALLPERRVPEMRQAARHFERAIALDPGYARAHVAAFDAYHLLDLYGRVSAAERTRAEGYLARALVLAPDLGEAHIARGTLLETSASPDAADREYRRGLQLAPGYASGYQWYGEFLANVQGRFDEALPLFEKAVALDPLSPVIRDVQIFTIGESGRVDEALAMSNRMIARQPRIARLYGTRADWHVQKGDVVAALRDLRTMATLDPAATGFQALGCLIMLDVGAVSEARACLAPLAESGSANPFVQAAAPRLARVDGDPQAMADYLASPRPYDVNRARMMVASGRMLEALALYRRNAPDLLATAAHVYPAMAADAIAVGVALIRTGERARGTALLHAAIDAVARRPYAAAVAGRSWLEVIALEQLGERDRAFAAMQAAVDAGYFLGLADLDADPLVAGLRADPRYARILAPARVQAAAQVEAAREAGLL